MTRRTPRVLAALLVALMVLCVVGASPSGGNLRIEEEASWHAGEEFGFQWQPMSPPGHPFEAAYRLYDSRGARVWSATTPVGEMLDSLPAPPRPGIYTVEAWLQDKAGRRGPPSVATLRFDNTVPLAPDLQPPEGWIGGTDAAVLRIPPAPAPLPLSGISGYALSVDRRNESSPCADPARCVPAEIDLAGSEGSISLGTLPEGLHFVRAVAVSGSGMASSAATAELRVDASPPLVSLQGVPAGWRNGPVLLSALARDGLSGMAATGPLGPFTAIAVDGAPPSRSFGDAATAWVSGSGIHEVAYFARDAAGNIVGDGGGAPGPATATVRIDEDPPAVTFSAAQDPAEPERIEAFVDDALSGPSPERGWIALRPAGIHGPFEQLPTQLKGDRLIAHWNSDAYPPGKYEFLVTGFDVAGNAGVGASRTRGGRMVLVNPLKVSTVLEAGFLGKEARVGSKRRARYGRGVRFGGSLRRMVGPPASGLEIAVTETFTAGSKPLRRTSFTRTAADGGFQVVLAPGPSREVVATFAGSPTLRRASSASAQLEVPASVRLRASTTSARIGGAPVVFRGRVAHAGTAARAAAGLPVELQFRFRGSGWREFRTVETDARGRFRYAYRFSDDDSRGVRFQFRTYVKGREGWPYEPAASRPVVVTGR